MLDITGLFEEFEEILVCYKCGYTLDGDDCDLEDGKPCCVGECPMSEEEWNETYIRDADITNKGADK